MAYTTDEKSTGLDVLTTLATGDLHIVGDVSDSGRAKAITENNLEITIANSSNFVDTLVANNYFTTELANDTNFVNELTTNTTFQTAVNNFVTTTGGGSSGTSSGKPISMSPTYIGSSHQQGYIDREAILYSNNGSIINFQSPISGIQSRDLTSDWASITGINGYVLLGQYLYILVAKGGSPLEQRLYRYDASDISTGGTLMTISGQAFGTTAAFRMTSDGINFYFNSDAGSNTNNNLIAKYTLSGTTLTYISTTTVGSTPAQFTYFAVDSSGQYIGTTTTSLYIYDNTGTLTDNLAIVKGSGDAYFLNWTNTIYIRNANLDLVKLNIPGTDTSGTGNGTIITSTASEDLTIGTPVGISDISGGVAKAIAGSYTKTITPNASTGPTSNCNIGTDKMVTVYVDSGSLKAYVSTVNRSDYANAFTQGTAVTVTATLQVDGLPFSVAKLDNDKFFIVYTETGNTAIARLVIATVSGTTITLGTAVDLYTFGELIETTSSVFVSTDKGFVTITGTTLPTRTIAFTASGTVATIGSSVALNASLVRGNVSSLINTDKIIVIASGYGQVATLSGTTITVGSAVQFDANWNTSTYLSNQDVISHTNDAFIVNYPDTAPSKQMIAATVSGTTITFGSKTAAASTFQNCLYPISSTKILASASGVGYIYTVSGTTISNPVFTNSTSPSRRNIINMGTYFIMYEQSTNSITYYIQGMAKGFIGFAQATVSRGATVTVLINGKDGNQSGLNPGSYYKVSAGSLISIDANQAIATLNDTVLVKALSATEITF